MKFIIYYVKHMNLQIACADNVSQIEIFKRNKKTHLTPLFCVTYAILFTSKTVLSWLKSRDAT